MERFPVELLYILAIVGFFLFNMLAQRAARRRQQEEAAQAPAEPPTAPAPEEALEDIWGRTSVPAPAVLASPPPPPPVRAAPPPPRRVHPVRALLDDPRDLRRAVVLTMVLGPCRAQEPPDERS